MAQVTIYLDSETERKMTAILKKRGISKSKWIAEIIREKAASSWPVSVVELAGAWKDLPWAEEIRAGFGQDLEREMV
jgi:hypothetical protein